jgi:hypothetical protein
MDLDLSNVGILTRRAIEAQIVAPLIKAFIKEFGQERTLEIVKGVIQSLARESGAQLANRLGGNSIEHFARGLELWKKDEALHIEILEQNESRFSFNILRCRYAEMYGELGIPEFGTLLSCDRDFDFIEDFNPKMRLARSRTIMEGADCCDFHYELRDEK